MGYIEESALVVRHNTLIKSRHKLTLQENRLVLWLISQIQTDDTEFTSYKIGAKQIADFIGIEGQNIYAEMRKTTHQLLSRVVEIESPNKKSYLQFQIVSRARYEEGTLELRVHEEMKPLLLQLKENFTKVELKYAMRFSSIYATRVYDLLQLNKFKRRSYNFDMGLDELRQMLGLQPKQYQVFPDFRRRILETAQKEINTKTDIRVEYRYKKTGRKITTISFQVTPQGENIPYLPASSNDKLLKQLEKIGFKAKDGASLIEHYKDDPERITFHIEQLKTDLRQDKDIKNPAGLLKYMIKQDRRPQTSFKDELAREDASKKEKVKHLKAQMVKCEQKINALTDKIKHQYDLYQEYKKKQISRVVATIAPDQMEGHKQAFKTILGYGVVNDIFQKSGWTHALIARDVIGYFQQCELMGEIMEQHQWEASQGFKTHDQIEKQQQDLKDEIVKILGQAQKAA